MVVTLQRISSEIDYVNQTHLMTPKMKYSSHFSYKRAYNVKPNPMPY